MKISLPFHRPVADAPILRRNWQQGQRRGRRGRAKEIQMSGKIFAAI
jgi:hypothetical protein